MTKSLRLPILVPILLLAGCASLPWSARTPDVWSQYGPAMQDPIEAQIEGLSPLDRYDIEVRIDPDAETQVTGYEHVLVNHQGQAELDQLYFRLYPNLLRYGGDMSINGVAVNGETVPFGYEAENTAVHFYLPEPLLPAEQTRVEFKYELAVPRRTSDYVLFGQSGSIISLPLFYPVRAVREMQDGQPEWDLNVAYSAHGDAAFMEAGLYAVTATVPSEMVLVGTGTVITRTASSEGEGWEQVRFAGGPRREFMLIMSPEYEMADTDACGATVTSYYLPEDERAGLLALRYAAAALRSYCYYFGPYPYRDMAVVSAPLRYFGMEYPGLNLIGVDLYRGYSQDLQFLVVHEVAHQWWYNLVGNDPVDYAWLDEGLAEYSAYTYYDSVWGEDSAEALWEWRWRAPYQYAVERGMDTVVDQSLDKFTSANYEVMVYAKAALFFDSLRRQMGDEMFYRVLRTYVDRNRWGVAVPRDFLDVAEEVSGLSLSELYRQWILTASRP